MLKDNEKSPVFVEKSKFEKSNFETIDTQESGSLLLREPERLLLVYRNDADTIVSSIMDGCKGITQSWA
jgi:hypothetical protein